MPEGLGGWLAFWAAFGLVDAVVEPTLSDTTRRTFRTHTPAGRTAFTAALVVGAYILHRHIVKP
jgi:hypothetical protein